MIDSARTQIRQSSFGNAFRLVWAATGVSNLGDGITLVALPLLAATLTRDPALIAGVAAAQRLPWLLFTLLSGALVDRVDRLALQRATNYFRAVVVASLSVALFLDWATIPLLFAAAFLLGVAETLFDNAAFALLPTIVDRDNLERANGRILTTQTIANEFVGPPVGGTLFALLAALPFLLGAVGYALAATLVGLLGSSFHGKSVPIHPPTSLWKEIVDGVQWFWQHRLLHVLGIQAAIEHGCWAATNAIFVLIAQERLGLDATAFGALLATGAAGGVIGALTAPQISMRLGTGRANLFNIVLQSLAYLGIASSNNPFLVAPLLGVLSFTGTLGTIVGLSFRQAIIPDQLLGRVSSAFRLYAVGAMAVGALTGGLLARTFGLLAPYWVSSGTLLLLAFILLPIVNNRTMTQARREALTVYQEAG